ncbi:peptidyl-prolyl cis-trans isomerase B (PPIase B; rotamase B) [Campylobacter sputorum subsp. bubulus]|uniref:Probable ATP-binding protein YbiT n=1 Tax=Campylobacter sputorum subsp. sputorum TaxID=32024 RepID=A0A381DH08_9BACT|nr:ATP-binding cassette domain-containing protein [Campylobacter sputorum]ASM35059.1 ABC transporter, ATP-binding protein [Campylobacter sputorum aubsp. sputorum RM3237]KAB0581338.1 ATP-binding cassette domain-containing protein [Campylobacter sputorum subsp. sputorum]QEL05249.1 ABC transporter, ATP-binding protein [Campylobacter sputorum subsp. sputorum]SUX08951.1 peptidyl-prolyl cis-trans isomerase B (PPIase B; rotamase B) [Campylobacter sputorum subsp. bubulus]SUX09737.1 peptidyl-prolyl cis
MLEVNSLSMKFGTQILFEDVNLKLNRGNRYGLIGANGAGKSTFLKILSGDVDYSSGDIIIENGLKTGTLGQDQFAFENFTIKDAVLYGNKRLYNAMKEKERLYMSEEFTDEINEKLSKLEIITAEEDPTYECETRIEKILSSLGLNNYDKLMSELENSDKFKVLLAQVLFPKPDILFLDEPTNNLDLSAISWLENELNRHEGTMVVISHDRHFLNRVCTHILDVDFKKIREFSGNYDDWYIAANLIKKQAQMQREKKLKEKEDLDKFIARFSANASKAKQATSRQKQLEKLNIEDIAVSSRREPSILFKLNREIGNEILELTNINKKFGDKVIFNNFNLKLKKGDKIAVIGHNGVGKTTLCKIIMKEILPDSGNVHIGATIETGYFAQDTNNKIKGELKLYEYLQDSKNKDLDEIRKCLGRMLFSGDEQEKSVGDLSGGEKHRVMLSKLMLIKPNLLILDEPNNHLDLEAIIALGEALYNYTGNVICVSHDRELIDAFANRIIEIKDNGEITDFKGTYEEYMESQIL